MHRQPHRTVDGIGPEQADLPDDRVLAQSADRMGGTVLKLS
jgi:hypothetical protein